MLAPLLLFGGLVVREDGCAGEHPEDVRREPVFVTWLSLQLLIPCICYHSFTIFNILFTMASHF